MKSKKMERNDIDQIVNAISQVTTKSETNKMVDILLKFISTASFALVMWVLSTVNAMQKDMVQLSSDAQYMKTALSKMEVFADKPRFTQENYDSQTLPLINALSSLTSTVTSIEKRLNTMDLERQKLQIAISELQKK